MNVIRGPVYLVLLLLLMSGCAGLPTTAPGPGEAASVVAQNAQFRWVRLNQRTSYRQLAEQYLQGSVDAWQLAELNGQGRGGEAGDVLAIPKKPLHSSSVYVHGYRTIPILCYHQFTPGNRTTQRLELSARDFRAQLNFLREQRFNVLTMDDVAAIMDGTRPIPPRAVVLTIDDGYRSVYDVAWPIIREFGFPVTLFIYTDFVGGGKALTWAQIREMQASGLVDIQSHAKSHTSLSRLPEDASATAYKVRVEDEINLSAQVLSRRLKQPVEHLSYPYGNSSALAAAVLEEQGYATGTTVTRGENTVFSPRFLLHRTMIYDNHSLDDFAGFVKNFMQQDLR